ncbi:MAG: cytochrome c-type biogenesis protein CcmH [Acidobacteriaceae bacterium]
MYKRSLQIVLIVFVAFTILGASSPSARFNRLGHDLMCTCGCSQILLECNHVGCPDSPGLIAELHSQINSGASDDAIFKFFATKYGPTILAAPFRGGFDDVGWVGPFAFLLFGIVLILLLLRVWKRRHDHLAPALPDLSAQEAEALRQRIRNETNYGE